MKRNTTKTALILGLGLLTFTCMSLSLTEHSERQTTDSNAGNPKINYVESDIDSLDFAMKIPDYMQATNSLDDGRPFQYMHEVKEHYIIASFEAISDVIPALEILGHSEGNLLDEYVAYNQGVIAEGVKISKQKPVKKLIVNGMQARMLQFDGRVEGIDQGISYFAIFVESPDNMYFVMAWTLQSKKAEFKPIAETMLKSFHLKKN